MCNYFFVRFDVTAFPLKLKGHSMKTKQQHCISWIPENRIEENRDTRFKVRAT